MRKMMLLAFVFLGGMVAYAQSTDSASHRKHRGGGTPEQRAEKQTKMLAEKLALNDSQKTAVKSICLETAQKMDALKKQEGLSKEDKKKQVVDLQKSKDEKITALLTPDQKTKYEAVKQKMKDKMKDKHKKKEGEQEDDD